MAELLDYHYKGSQKDNKFRQARSLFARLGPRKTGGLLLTLLVMLVLPVTLIAVRQQQNIKQHAAETTGLGCPINFTDANTPSLACLNRTYCITRGDGATTFGPNTIVSRQEFIAFITRYHLQVKKDWTAVDPSSTTDVPDTTLFTDVPRTHALAKDIYTAKKYGWVKGDGVGFDPNGNWTFGFHGIIREGSTTNNGAATADCYSGCYTFTSPGGTITRQALIDQMYEFGKANADLVTCLITPTVTQAPVQATPVSAQPIVNDFSPVSCSNPVTYPKSFNTTYPLLAKVMDCLNQKYCVVQGNSHVEINADNLGYTTPLTRSQYVTFIARYHTQVLKDDWKAAYDTIGDYYKQPGTKRFYDVSADQTNPNYHALWREIYTSQKMGFIVGFEDNTFKPEGLWRYGFHGITRTDSYNGSYNFATLGNPITRGDFLTLLYDYGYNVKRQLTACIPTPTPTHANFPDTVIPTSTPTIKVTSTPTPKPLATATPSPTVIPTATPTPTVVAGSTINVYAEGTVLSGVYPIMDLYINGVIVKRWSGVNVGVKAYTYTALQKINAASIKVVYTNDANTGWEDRNLRVTKIVLDGVNYPTTASTVYEQGVASWSGCASGYLKSEWLNCNGYFQFK